MSVWRLIHELKDFYFIHGLCSGAAPAPRGGTFSLITDEQKTSDTDVNVLINRNNLTNSQIKDRQLQLKLSQSCSERFWFLKARLHAPSNKNIKGTVHKNGDVRFKFCHTILWSLSAKMSQSRQSLLIAHWVHERILMSTCRWLALKKWYGKPLTDAMCERTLGQRELVNWILCNSHHCRIRF